MKKFVAVFTCCSLLWIKNFAQHCPWDCAGMIMIKTSVPKEVVYKMNPVLVDEHKEVITETMFGSGKDTYDRCNFMDYKDFTRHRAMKISVHHWYQYDTLYSFAYGHYIAKFNYCKFKGRKLYLRYTDIYSQSAYHYIELPTITLIHLHDYSVQLFDKKPQAIKNGLKNNVLVLSCKDWGISEGDCKTGK